MMLAANFVAALEGCTLLQKHGVDVGVATAAMAQSSADSAALRRRVIRRVLPRTFDYGFTLGLLDKDVSVALSMSRRWAAAARARARIDTSPLWRRLGVSVPVSEHVGAVLRDAVEKLGPDVDNTLLATLIEARGGVEISADAHGAGAEAGEGGK